MAWVSPLLLRPESAAIFQSLLPGTSHLKAPFETDQAMEKHLDFWEMGHGTSSSPCHFFIASCMHWWLFTNSLPCLGAAVLGEESVWDRHHLVSPRPPLPRRSLGTGPSVWVYTQWTFWFFLIQSIPLCLQLHQQDIQHQCPPHLLGDLRWRYRLIFRLQLETGPTFLLSLQFISGISLNCFHRYRPGKEHLKKGWRKIGKKTLGFPFRESPPSVEPSVFSLLASFPK